MDQKLALWAQNKFGQAQLGHQHYKLRMGCGKSAAVGNSKGRGQAVRTPNMERGGSAAVGGGVVDA